MLVDLQVAGCLSGALSTLATISLLHIEPLLALQLSGFCGRALEVSLDLCIMLALLPLLSELSLGESGSASSPRCRYLRYLSKTEGLAHQVNTRELTSCIILRI